MENLHKPVIVPWDFTHVAEFALAHAVNICKILNREIILLHIVENPDATRPSFEKLTVKSLELSRELNVKVHPLVESGNIFETIREMAEKYKAEMVIMGTHGIKGMQKLFGSWALKVMAHSRVPFLVVQKKPERETFKKIVFPIDFRSSNKEKVKWIHYLSGHYNSTFLIFKRKASDRGFRRKIASNLFYAESYLKNNDISFEIHTSKGKKSFEKETVDFAIQQDADLIMVMVTRDIGFFDYIIAAREQYIISNSGKVPVLCANPKPARIAAGFSATGG